MSKNNQQPHSENPKNQFSSSKPMTFAQKVEYVKNMKMKNNKPQIALEKYLLLFVGISFIIFNTLLQLNLIL
jgi:hypothetical protein